MPHYDFKSLSSQDFEDLTRDLLQAEWRVSLEAFRVGRDSGIDLRYIQTHRGATIIQCKHYVTVGVSKLLRDLRRIELPKIKLLNPRRYVIVTSTALTPFNKKKIKESLHPFIKSEKDIYGAQDIDGLLSRFPEIERKNFKLWLTNTLVIERVIHNAELCQTDFQLERIQRKLPIFVQNDGFPRAMNLLESSRIVVISGVPGIGKTTLAEMLIYAHLADGYEPVVIQSDITEAKKFFRPEKKQIFYFDDFLGQIFLGDRGDYLGRNQDMALVDFLEMVRRSKASRFILTTREHILTGALQISERLAHSEILNHKCILELKDYSQAQKARILYNHLYFSDLKDDYIGAILKDDFFLTIIKHAHFNPRIIEWLSTYAKLSGITPDNYQSHISELLASPLQIWEYAYRTQISNAARNVLLAFYTLGEWANVKDLETPFMSFNLYWAEKYHQPINQNDFMRSLQELDGSFLTFKSGYVSYINPSVREFVSSIILKNKQIAEDLLESSIRFKQIGNIWELSSAYPNSELALFLRLNHELLYLVCSRLLNVQTDLWSDWGDEAKIGLLAKISSNFQLKQFVTLISHVTEKVMERWKTYTIEYSSLMPLLREIVTYTWFLNNGGREIVQKLLESALEGLVYARAEDWQEVLSFSQSAPGWINESDPRVDDALKKYCKSGVYEDKSERTDLDELETLLGILTELNDQFGIDFQQPISGLRQDIAEREDNRRFLKDERGILDRRSFERDLISDDDIRDMFRTLEHRL